MALFAKSKVDRFQEEPSRSSLGPGDYDPCVPQTNGNGAGAVSLGFTSSKGLPTSPKEEPIPEETESTYSTAVRDRRASTSVGVAPSSRRLSIGSPRTAPSLAMTRQEKAEAQQQAKQLSWSELEREKLQAEVAKLRLREVILSKNERQARADAAKAIKRAELAERKSSAVVTDASRVEAAEATASRLAEEISEATRVAEEAGGARTALQTRSDELESETFLLRGRIEELSEKEAALTAELAAEAAAVSRREEEFKLRVVELQAAHAAGEEMLQEARGASIQQGKQSDKLESETASLKGRIKELSLKEADFLAEAAAVGDREDELELRVEELRAEAAAGEERFEEARSASTKRIDELESETASLRAQVKELSDKEALLTAEADAAREREGELKARVVELRAAMVAGEEKLAEARASAERSAMSAEEATQRAEAIGDELAASVAGTGVIKTASSKLESELSECKSSLQASGAMNGELLETASALREERGRLVVDAEGLEGELATAKAALEGAVRDVAAEGKKLSAVEASRAELQARLEETEASLKSSCAEKLWLERALCEEKANTVAVQRELETTREALSGAERRGGSLEGRLEASAPEASRLELEVEDARSKLSAAEDNVKRLEAAMAETAENVAALQQRLGDALAEGVDYADEAIRSEERLRSSEADCAALWEEREEAKERLCAAFVQGRALEEKLEESVTDAMGLRKALGFAEARLASSVEDGDEYEEELAASRDECAVLKRDLERVGEKYAKASSEARLLKASLEDVRPEVERLEGELEGAQCRLDEWAAEEGRLKAELALREAKNIAVKRELIEALAHLDTGAADFVALETKLCETETTCDRLRSALESTEMTISEVTADADRARLDLHGALLRCTGLQERLSAVDERLSAVVLERRELEERLAESAASGTRLERTLEEVEIGRSEAVADRDRLRNELEETALESAVFQERLAASEEAAATAHVSSEEADALKARLQTLTTEFEVLREAHEAALMKANKFSTLFRGLETRMGGVDAEVERLRAELADKDGRLEEASSALAESQNKNVENEAECERLLAVCDDIGASYAEGNATSADWKQGVADIQGIGLELGQKLAVVVAEKDSLQGKLEVAQASLAASSANRRSLERDLETSLWALDEARQENDACHTHLAELQAECQQLREAGHTQAMGAATMLAESRAREEETIARLQLVEVQTSQEVALANKEVQRAITDLDNASAEIIEMRAISDLRAKAGKLVPETTMPSERLIGGTDENASVVVHINSINKSTGGGVDCSSISSSNCSSSSSGENKSGLLQDVEKENVRLASESARLSSELALATAVLEAVGVISKDVVVTTAVSTERRKSDAGVLALGAGRGRGLKVRRASETNSLSPPSRGVSGVAVKGSNGVEGNSSGKAKKRSTSVFRRRKSSPGQVTASPLLKSPPKPQPSSMALHDRLQGAVEIAESPQQQIIQQIIQQQQQPKQNQQPQPRGLSQGMSPIGRNCTQAVSTGCFSSIKCGGTDVGMGVVDTSPPDSGDRPADYSLGHDHGSSQLMDERVRDTVKKALFAQAVEAARPMAAGPE